MSNNAIGERLRFLRGELSQAKFAAKIGLKQTTYGKYERGESSLGLDVASDICTILGVNPRWLTNGEKPIYDSLGSVKSELIEKAGTEEMQDLSMAERIAFIRGEMTQKEFAQKVGIKLNTLRKYETGQDLPNQDFLATLCYYLNVNPEWILLGKGEPFKGGIKDIAEANERLLNGSDAHYEEIDKDAETVQHIKTDAESHTRMIRTLLERNRLYKDNLLIREFYYRIMFDVLLLSGRYDIIKNDMKSDTKELKKFFKSMSDFFNKYKDDIKDFPSVTDILKHD